MFVLVMKCVIVRYRRQNNVGLLHFTINPSSMRLFEVRKIFNEVTGDAYFNYSPKFNTFLLIYVFVNPKVPWFTLPIPDKQQVLVGRINHGFQ
jgi:hypothetical protein